MKYIRYQIQTKNVEPSLKDRLTGGVRKEKRNFYKGGGGGGFGGGFGGGGGGLGGGCGLGGG